jgi:hypothetical protein
MNTDTACGGSESACQCVTLKMLVQEANERLLDTNADQSVLKAAILDLAIPNGRFAYFAC